MVLNDVYALAIVHLFTAKTWKWNFNFQLELW